MIYQACGLDKEKPQSNSTVVFLGGQGGIRTLGPVKDYLISSQGRYDHFDTCPYENDEIVFWYQTFEINPDFDVSRSCKQLCYDHFDTCPYENYEIVF